MLQQEQLLDEARLIVQRLEKISADSVWARRSSGHRGALLKWIEKGELCAAEGREFNLDELNHLKSMVLRGFQYLEKAARERFP
jgi:hypothetical protein